MWGIVLAGTESGGRRASLRLAEKRGREEKRDSKKTVKRKEGKNRPLSIARKCHDGGGSRRRGERGPTRKRESDHAQRRGEKSQKRNSNIFWSTKKEGQGMTRLKEQFQHTILGKRRENSAGDFTIPYKRKPGQEGQIVGTPVTKTPEK